MQCYLSSSLTFSERLGLSGQVTVIGMLTIFLVLIILMASLYLMQLFTYTLPKKKKEKAEKEQKPQVDDAQLIAVLTAAIAAYEGENGSSIQEVPFRVVSFKRKTKNAPWTGSDDLSEE
ncbi:MAG: OadG family protein [Clostridia bacterium]|nr:OadG family protein [Clostridia bacterium]